MEESVKTVQRFSGRALLFFAAAAAFWLTGCASTIQYPPFPDQSKKVEDPTKARVYVIRTQKVFEWGASMIFYGTDWAATGPIYDPDQKFPPPFIGAGNYSKSARMRRIGEIGPGSYICWETPPHPFPIEGVEGDTNSIFTLNLEAGNVYYLRGTLYMGWVKPWSKIKVISEAEGVKLLKTCKPPPGYVR